MKTQAQVVVIGGGVVGCSVLYHLTKYGWKDVMLIERSTLTSGSTWHAAGGFHTLNGDTNMAALQGYTIGLYKELEAITGMSCGLHHVGGITLADNQARFEMLVAERAKHRYMGLHTEILGPELSARWEPAPMPADEFTAALSDWMRGLSGDALASHIAAHRRLTHSEEMGTLFKALALVPPGAPLPPGFAPATAKGSET